MSTQMIHGYTNSVSQTELTNNQVVIDTDVEISPSVWESKKLSQLDLLFWITSYMQSNATGISLGAVCRTDVIPSLANTAYPIKIDDNWINNGYNLVLDGFSNYTIIQLIADGAYKISYQLQVNRTTGGSAQSIYTWIRLNGNNVAYTTRHLNVESNSGHLLLSNDVTLGLAANDEIEIMYAVTDTAIRLEYTGATALFPENPSMILNINRTL